MMPIHAAVPSLIAVFVAGLTVACRSVGDPHVADPRITAATAHGDLVLIIGGHQGRRAAITLFASAETFDPITGSFSRVGDMRLRRHKHDAILLHDGRVLVTGGADERDSEGPTMRQPRYEHHGSAVLLPSGVVLLAGGASQAETFDPLSGMLTIVSGTIVSGEARMAGQFSAVAALPGGGALVTGGYGNRGGPRASAWTYRP